MKLTIDMMDATKYSSIECELNEDVAQRILAAKMDPDNSIIKVDEVTMFIPNGAGIIEISGLEILDFAGDHMTIDVPNTLYMDIVRTFSHWEGFIRQIHRLETIYNRERICSKKAILTDIMIGCRPVTSNHNLNYTDTKKSFKEKTNEHNC